MLGKVAAEMGLRGIVTNVLLAVVIALLVAWLFANPVEEAADRVAEPIAESLGVLAGQCPTGWADESARDEHAVVRSCSREVDGLRWLVILDEEGEFSHCFAKDQPGAVFIFEAEECPGWPR